MENLLLLHGWGGNENSFAHILPNLRNFYNCIHPAMPMFKEGDSHPEIPWTLEDYADYILRILDEKGITKTHILAHSFGARVAAILYRKRPEMFSKFVLTGAAGIKRRFRPIVWARIALYKLKRKLGYRGNGGSAEYRVLNPNGKKTFQNIISANIIKEIKAIKVPQLLIYGRDDKATSTWMGKRWTRISQNAKLRIYKDAGHFCFIDFPTRFINEMLNFLEEA